jgi:hypothetical protein
MLKKGFLHPNLFVRFFSLFGVMLLFFLVMWTISYLFLPEGILRGRTGAQALAGSEAAGSVWLEFARIAAINLTMTILFVALPCFIQTEQGYPYGYFVPFIWAALYAVTLGTNSFTFALPGGKMAPSMEVLSRSGLYELAAYLLTAASLHTIARYKVIGTWPRQKAERIFEAPRLELSQWMGLGTALMMLLAANAREAYQIVSQFGN